MAAFKYPKILYFIAEHRPNDDEYRNGMRFGPGVAFRNVSAIGEIDKPEACDGVAGLVPAQYSAFPLIKSPADAGKLTEAVQDPETIAAMKGKPERQNDDAAFNNAPTTLDGIAKDLAPKPNPGAAAAWKKNA